MRFQEAYASEARAGARARQRRALALTLGLNAAFLIAEVVGGLVFGSLALLADAAHMVIDVAALAIALVALRLIERPASARHTYGLQRAEVLAALINGIAMLAAAGWIMDEAANRLGSPTHPHAAGMLAVAAAGVVVNAVSALTIARTEARTLNMRGALLHMAADAAASAGTVGAAIAILAAGAVRADPIASIAIAVLVLASAVRLIGQTVHVLLEGTPRGMRLAEVERALRADLAVTDVHHLHLWSLASDVPSLSAHVVLESEPTLHDAQEQGARLKQMLADRFGILHATLELECHVCEPEPAERPTPT